MWLLLVCATNIYVVMNGRVVGQLAHSPLKTITVGMLLMPISVATPGDSSVFSFKHTSLPAFSAAISSMRGAIIRQGPHHGAQKSTTTGRGLLSTCSNGWWVGVVWLVGGGGMVGWGGVVVEGK